jgi:type IV secretion system protein VirD4
MDYQSPRHVEYSRWASEEEIKASLYKIIMNEKIPKFGGMPLYADSKGIYVEHEDYHTLIMGLTGAGKSRRIIMPSLWLFALSGESIIVTDPKAELYERTLPLLEEQGYNVYVINLREPKKSNCWNPLDIPYKLYKNGDRDHALELVTDMADCIVKDSASREPYWHNSAADLFTGLLAVLFECAKENEIHLKSLRTFKSEAFTENDDSSVFIKECFLDYVNKSSFVYSVLNGTVGVCDSTRGCIVSTFDQAMKAFFCQDGLLDMLSFSDFGMNSIGKKKTAVFLITPDENTIYHKLISVFVKQCYTELILEAQKYPDKKLPLRVNFILDEFANLPEISDFSSMISASRSRNIRFNLIIQGLQQLKHRYGVNAETIKGNCENWIYLHSRDFSLLDEIICLAGKKNSEENLLTVSMLQTLDKEKGEALVFHKRLHPFIANLKDIDQYPKLSNENSVIKYPENTRKATEIFSFEDFCRRNGTYHISLLFCGKTPQEIEEEKKRQFICVDEDDDIKFKTIFTRKVPSDEETEKTIEKIAKIEKETDDIAANGQEERKKEG